MIKAKSGANAVKMVPASQFREDHRLRQVFGKKGLGNAMELRDHFELLAA